MPDIIADVLAPFEKLARDFAETSVVLARHGAMEAYKALDAARMDLTATVMATRNDFATLSVDQYAALHRVHPRTVARWIDARELAAEQTAKGWRIRRTAIRQKTRIVATHG